MRRGRERQAVLVRMETTFLPAGWRRLPEGGYGSDTYVWPGMAMVDTINQYTYSVDGGTDRLKFGEGITSEEIDYPPVTT